MGSFALQAWTRIVAMSHCYTLASWTAAVFCRFRHPAILSKRQRTGALQNLRPCVRFIENAPGGRPQGPFKIKKPSQNAGKTLKVNKGKLRVFETPPGVTRFIPQSRRQKDQKTFILNHFTHVSTLQFMSFFTPKNTRFMPDFHQRQFVNKSQRFCSVHANPRVSTFSFFLFPSLPAPPACRISHPSRPPPQLYPSHPSHLSLFKRHGGHGASVFCVFRGLSLKL